MTPPAIRQFSPLRAATEREPCEGCHRAAENYARLRAELARFLRAIHRDGSDLYDKRAGQSGWSWVRGTGREGK